MSLRLPARPQNEPFPAQYLAQIQAMASRVEDGHRHPVLREGPGLVGADDRDRAQGLDGRKLPDEGPAREHALGGQSERHRDDGGKPLGDGRHGHADRGQEHQPDGLSAQQTEREEYGHHRQRRAGQDPAEPLELALEGSGFSSHSAEQFGDAPQLGAHPRRHDGRQPPARYDGRAHIGHAAAVAQGEFDVSQRGGVLERGLGLACQGGFFDAQVRRLEHAAVRRHAVARVQKDDVAADELARGKLENPASAPDSHARHGQPLERRHGHLRFVLLEVAEESVQDQYGDDRRGVGPIAEQGRDRGRDRQQAHHHGGQLLPQDPPPAPAGRLDEGVGTIASEASGRLAGIEAPSRVRPQARQNLGRVEDVPRLGGMPGRARRRVHRHGVRIEGGPARSSRLHIALLPSISGASNEATGSRRKRPNRV